MKEYRDYYFKKAKEENFPARSVYKLQEIDNKFKILRPGMKVLDLGASPGSWALFAAKKIGSNGGLLACDLKPLEIALPSNSQFLCQNIFELQEEFKTALNNIGPFNLVMSDMAPPTTGNRVTDQARSLNLAEEAFLVASQNLKNGGNFIVKIFMGSDADNWLKSLKTFFASIKPFKPKSSRSESKEIFYIALNFKLSQVNRAKFILKDEL